MTRREIRDAVNNMTVLIDTREQDTLRARKRIKAIDMPVERVVLDYGDYSYNTTLPGGEPLYDTSGRIYPKCVIERKMDLDELAACLGASRERFEREWERASEHGARLWLLVENATWGDLFRHHYRSHMEPSALLGSIIAWQCRYDARLVFCSESESGRLIREILQKDLRQRLEGGEFDGQNRMDKAILPDIRQ